MMMLYLPEYSYLDGTKTTTIEGTFLGVKVRIVPGQLGSLPTNVAIELRRFHPEAHQVIDHPSTPADYPAPPSLIIEE